MFSLACILTQSALSLGHPSATGAIDSTSRYQLDPSAGTTRFTPAWGNVGPKSTDKQGC